MKILLPIDGSEHTKRMLSYIAAHDDLLGPGHDYTVFTVVPAVPLHVTRFLDRTTIESYYQDQADEVMRPVKRFAEQQGWKISTAHATGPAAEEIAAFAEAQKPDLIVMGTHGHSSLGNVIMGSVATGVLARCKQPVLLVR